MNEMELIRTDKESKFILVIFQAGEKSITRMGVWREVFNGEVKNTVIADYSIWKMSLNKQVSYLTSLLDDNKKNFIVFIPGTNIPECIPKELVKELRCMKRTLDGIVLYLMDGVERMAKIKKMPVLEFNQYFDVFDIVYHYDLYEASKYGFVYAPLPLKKFEIKQSSVKQTTKVFFIGRAKGRLELIQDVAKFLDKNKIDYEFLILKEKNNNSEDIGNIHFIDYLKYDLVIRKIEEATCLLSLVSSNANMMSASFTESVLYNKKLLTNCKFLSELPCYDERYMQSFESVEDIDINWLCSSEKVQYNYEGQFSAKYFLDNIEKDYLSGFLKKCAILNQKNLEIGKPVIKFSYHFSKIGWIHDVENLQPVVMKGQLEAIGIKCPYDDCKILYETKQKGLEWKKADSSKEESCGIIGKSIPITAIRLKVECKDNKYEIFYRVYINEIGWTNFASNGVECGFLNDKLENVISGIQIFLVNNTMNVKLK